MRGLENVRAEFSLSALAYNIIRAINILGVDVLITFLKSRPSRLGWAWSWSKSACFAADTSKKRDFYPDYIALIAIVSVSQFSHSLLALLGAFCLNNLSSIIRKKKDDTFGFGDKM